MAWTIEFLPEAQKDLARLDRQTAQRIVRFLDERIAISEDPRSIGDPLHGPELGKYWRYRVGDYRIVVSVKDELVAVVVVRIGHRGRVYR